MTNRSATWLATLHILGDLALTLAALWMADALRFRIDLGRGLAGLDSFLNPFLFVLAGGVWLLTFGLLRVYDTQRVVSLANQLQSILLATPAATFVFSGALYLSFRDVSRLMVAYFFVADLLLLMAFRLSLALVLSLARRRGYLARRVLIIGYNDLGRDIATLIRTRGWMNLEVVGFLDPAGGPAAPGDPPVLGTPAVAARMIGKFEVDDVIIALPGEERGLVPRIALDLLTQPVRVKVVPDLHHQIAVKPIAEDLWGIPLIALREPVIRGFAWAVKRTFDILFSATVLVVLAPVFAAIALLIRWRSPGGPIFFRQRRIGENGRPFTMYKFRTMRPDAEQLLRQEAPAGDKTAIACKRPNDPRVTGIGRFLRRYSLDELPQFWNVLKGDMSVVGPRPEQCFIVDAYEPWQRKRLAVPPGITGWWQVNGRSDLPMHLNTEYDLYYIQNYSPLLDLRIIWRTIGVVLRGTGAY